MTATTAASGAHDNPFPFPADVGSAGSDPAGAQLLSDLVDGGAGSRRHARALYWMGWRITHIADYLGVPRTTLLLCFARVADIPFLQELQHLAAHAPWFDLCIHITREDITAHGPFVPGRPSPQSLLALGQPQAVVICGGHAFAQTFREHARACFPGAIQHIEAFTPPAASM